MTAKGCRAAVAAAAVLVVAAVGTGAYLNRPGSGVSIHAPAAPLFAWWLPHIGPGTPAAVVVAVVVVAWGPALAGRARWRVLLPAAYVAAVAWTFALALVDGWDRGVADRLTTRDEYLHEVPGITDVRAALRGFTDRILDFQPGSWTTHVSGHPPLATLVFVWLDRIGLGGGAWAAVLCVVVGCLAAVAVPVALVLLGRADAARAVVPFAVLAPGAVWVGASADGVFAGVTACGVALLALAARRASAAVAVAAGVVLGAGAFLSYGLVLIGLVALAAVVCGRRWSVAPWAVLGAVLVVVVFAVAGFSWWDGYHLVTVRYYQGIATERPYWYWAWANLAATCVCAGPAVVAALPGLRRGVRSRCDPVLVLVAAAAAAVLVADLSGLSKAEVERIWLPFVVWLWPAVSLLPGKQRGWLAAQAATALVVNHLLMTNW
ncbi:hypothetical protein V5P93_003846 [Actinokineospora auranticolor]|nr:hypothetical protein [Actinokineospora auranticolor]